MTATSLPPHMSPSSAPSTSRDTAHVGNLWSEILESASRRGHRLARKHVVVLAEPNRGKRTLIENVIKSPQSSYSSSTTKPPRSSLDILSVGRSSSRSYAPDARGQRDAELRSKNVQVVGYEWVDISEDGDMETVPPLSIYSAASSDKSAMDLVPLALPANSIEDTAVIILLDWTKPHRMMPELVKWLAWVDQWAGQTASREQAVNGHDRLQSHIQHYVEPAVQTVNPGSTATDAQSQAMSSSSFAAGLFAGIASEPLPLGPGMLTHNTAGIPIIIVVTKSDRIDSVGDEMIQKGLISGKGIGGGGERGWAWDERVDWVQQMLRCVALKYGAALFYTSPARPETYSRLKSYILHRLYTTPPPLHQEPDTETAKTPTTATAVAPVSRASRSTIARFGFPFRASVVDRNAVMVPTGWDSWGKINVLRDGFEAEKVGEAWESSLARLRPVSGRMEEDMVKDEDEQGIEEMWSGVVPDLDQGLRTDKLRDKITEVEPEQDFLSRQLDMLMRDPSRDPRKAFRSTSGQSSNRGIEDASVGGRGVGVVGPLAGGGLSMPSVELAMKQMEGGQASQPGMTRKSSGRDAQSPGGEGSSAEVLSNFFQGLIAGRRATPTGTPTTE